MKYPEIYMSDELNDFKKNHYEILANHKFPEITEIPPNEPKKPEEPSSFSFKIFLSPLIFSFFSYVIFKFNIIAALITYFIILIIVFIIFLSSNSNIERDKLKYFNLKKKYDEDKDEYEYKLTKRKVNLAHFALSYDLTPESADERNQYIKNIILPKTSKARIKYPNIKKGKMENFFLEVLQKYFGTSIKKDYVVEIFEYREDIYGDTKKKNAYCPDFIFEHSLSDLCIDIEIDEPYNQNDTLHAISDLQDYDRNKYFMEKGWVIIRFSEEQIKNVPLSCCKEIAKLIKIITNDTTFSNMLINIPDLYRHRKWDYEDIPKLRALNYRNLSNPKIEELLK